MPCAFWGLGFEVHGVGPGWGCRVLALGLDLGVCIVGCGAWGVVFEVWGLGSERLNLWLTVWGPGVSRLSCGAYVVLGVLATGHASTPRPPLTPSRCQTNMAHIRQPGPDSGLGVQVKVPQALYGVSSSLGSGGWGVTGRGTQGRPHPTPTAQQQGHVQRRVPD